MALLFFLTVSVVLVAGVEALKRTTSIPVNITRRIVHLGSTVIAFFAPLYIDHTILFGALLLFALAVFISRKRQLIRSVHNIDGKAYGDVFLPLGEALAVLVFLPGNILAFQFGILILGVADSAAGLVGDYLGKRRVTFLNTDKSLEGATAFLSFSLLVSFLFLSTMNWEIAAVCVLLTVAELACGRGTDNLVLPVLAGGLFILVV